nr:MAG TPA: hypothetical protein [Caudoviricetes sp.]
MPLILPQSHQLFSKNSKVFLDIHVNTWYT